MPVALADSADQDQTAYNTINLRSLILDLQFIVPNDL